MDKWDERYQGADYFFGTEPHPFLQRILPYLPRQGRALDLATGEGRNGVFLAGLGLQAEGVDASAAGLAKARRLAEEKGVAFALRQADIRTMPWPQEHYALITCVLFHLAEPERSRVAQQAVRALVPGGLFAGVFYHPNQIALGSGGPKDPAMLATLPQLQQAFAGLQWLVAEHEEDGKSVVSLLGRKASA